LSTARIRGSLQQNRLYLEDFHASRPAIIFAYAFASPWTDERQRIG
jgi:hypothetical protein